MEPQTPRVSPPTRPRRPDASMTLLTEVMQRPLDPGYALAARRRAEGRHPGPVVRAVTVLLAVICGVVTTWSAVQLRRPQPDGVERRQALEREIERQTSAADGLQKGNAALRDQIAGLQASVLRAAGDSALMRDLRVLEAAAGEGPVTGPGLEITLDDAPTVTAGGSDPRQAGPTDDGRVLDRDLQIVVNGLWAAGAEAIAVNNQRLTSRAPIRSAGQAILVDFRPLVAPYVVRAVGDPAALQAAFARGMAGPYLQGLESNFGIRSSIVARQTLSLPGAGSLTLRYAKPSLPITPSASSSATSAGSPSGSPTAPAVAPSSPAAPTQESAS